MLLLGIRCACRARAGARAFQTSRGATSRRGKKAANYRRIHFGVPRGAVRVDTIFGICYGSIPSRIRRHCAGARARTRVRRRAPLMNHRCRQAQPHRPRPAERFTAVLACALGVVLALMPARPAAGQAAAASRSATLPADLKTAVDVRPRLVEIQNFIKAQVAVLSSDKDPEAQKRAREALINGSSATGIAPSASFMTTYAQELNRAVLPLAQSKSARTRLNVAIAVARVAKNANNGELDPAAAALALDGCEGVSLWAVKSSQSIVL